MTTVHTVEEVIDAISSTSTKDQAAALIAILIEQSGDGRMNEQDVATRMMAKVLEPDFHEKPGSWIICNEIATSYWQLLDSDQHLVILNRLCKLWGRFHHWMGTFVASEILGRKDPSNSMLEFFQNAAEFIPRPQNSLACYGIQKIAEAATDRRIMDTALDVLTSMQKSSDEGVQKEAQQALARLSRKLA